MMKMLRKGLDIGDDAKVSHFFPHKLAHVKLKLTIFGISDRGGYGGGRLI